MEQLKIVFFGTPEFAVPSLKMLLKSGEHIAAVVTQPDRPAGRGQKPAASAIKKIAVCHNLKVLQPEKVRDEKFIKALENINPDICIVAAFGQIFPKKLLEIPKFGFINVHSSLLPRYRGASPVNHAIINGDDLTGITIMLVDEGLDTGDLLLQEKTPIYIDDDAWTLSSRLAELGAQTLAKALYLKKRGFWNPVPQDSSKATYAPQLKKTDGLINWEKPGKSIINLIRGMAPWPGCFTYLQGKRVKIYKAECMDEDHDAYKPGQIISVSQRGIMTATGKGVVVITELQVEGKKRMSSDEFIRGHKPSAGMFFTESG